MTVNEQVERALQRLERDWKLYLFDPEVWSLEVLAPDSGAHRVTIDYGDGPSLYLCTRVELELVLHDYFVTLAQVESL